MECFIHKTSITMNIFILQIKFAKDIAADSHICQTFSIIGKILNDFNIIYFHLFLNYPFSFSFIYFYNMYSKLFPLPHCLCFQGPLLISFGTVMS